MDTDEIFLSMIERVTLDVLERIGDDPEARYQFFKRFVELAREVTGQDRPVMKHESYARNLSRTRVSQVGIGTGTGIGTGRG